MRIQAWLDRNKDIGILLLRLFVGTRLIFGVFDNIISRERMTEFRDFLDKFHFPFPMVSATISIYAQFISGLLIVLGYKIRLASSIMIVNFLIALLMVHSNDTFETMTPALAMFFSCIVLFFYGSDKYSIEQHNSPH